MYRIDELEADAMKKGTPDTPCEATGNPVSPNQQRADAGRTVEAVDESLREVVAREKAANEQQAKDQAAHDREAKETEALRVKVGFDNPHMTCLPSVYIW